MANRHRAGSIMYDKIFSALCRLFQKRLAIFVIVLAIILTGPLLSYVRPVAAVSYSPGVKPGDNAIYGNVTASWNSSIAGLAPPPFLAEFLNVQMINLTVQKVSASNIIAVQTFRFTNGTAAQTLTLNGSIVDSSGNLSFWILASGLTAGSPLYNIPNSPTMNTTTTQFFAGTLREVNHFIVDVRSLAGENATLDWAWDNSTGVLVSFASNYSYSSSTGSFVGHSFVGITSTNLWSAGPTEFAVFAGSGNLTVNAGSSVTDSIYVISVNDTGGIVSLSTRISPAGPTMILSQSTLILPPGGNASSILTVMTNTSTVARSYSISINGTSGSVSHSAKIALTVEPANSPDFSISASPSFLKVPVLTRANYTIAITSLDGFNKTVTLGVSTGGTSVSLQPPTVTGSGIAILRALATSPGNYTIEIIATSGYLYHTLTVSLDAIPSSTGSSISIDGSSGVGCLDTTSSCSVTLTTKHPDDIIIAFATESLDIQTSCSFAISDTAGLSWTARSKMVFSLDGREQLQEFWARSVGPLSSDTVTESISGCGNNYNNLMAFGISGANFGAPFDPNPALPGTATGTSGGTSVQVSTTSPNDMIFAAVLHENTAAFPTAEPGFTIITPLGTNAVEYETVDSTVTNSTVTFGDQAVGVWSSIGDAVQAASKSQDFAFFATPPTLTVSPSRPSTTKLNLVSLNGFSGRVDLSVFSVLPGFSVSIQPPSLLLATNGTAMSALTVTVGSNVTANFDLLVNATSGSLTHTVLIQVIAKALVAPSYSITGPSNITVTASSTIQATIVVSSLNNFTGAVSLTPGVLPVFTDGPFASLSPSQVSLSPGLNGFATLTIATTSLTPIGPYNYTISGTASSVGGFLNEFFVGQLLVQPIPQPDFSLNAYPTSLLTIAGSSASSTIDVFPIGSVSGNVTVFLSAQIPPINGLTASLFPAFVNISPTSFGGTSTLTLSTLSTTPPGNYTVTVVGHGGIFTHTVAISLRVLPPPELVLTPTSGAAGTRVLVRGSGFPVQYGTTELLVTFDDQLLGFTFTSNGSFNFTFDVPLAQPGPHAVKASEPGFTGNTLITATAAFQVLPSPISLTVSLTSGTVYFPGDTASFFVLLTQNGQPTVISDLQLTLQILKPDGSTQNLTVTRTATGVYAASYKVPSTNSLGTYAVIVKAHSPTAGDSSTITSFEVKPTWLNSHGTTLIAGATVAGLAGLVGVAWQQGYFRKKRGGETLDWNVSPKKSES